MAVKDSADAISGLSERLRKRSAPSEYSTGDVLGEEAATQLDALQARVESLVVDRDTLAAWAEKEEARARALLKERDALQARVKELEDEKVLVWVDATHKGLERALRAEQERDEAYERAAKAIDAAAKRQRIMRTVHTRSHTAVTLQGIHPAKRSKGQQRLS